MTTPPAGPGEIWLPVVGWEGRYMVSSHGRVWSVPREVLRNDKWGGQSTLTVGGGLLAQHTGEAGYHDVGLSRDWKPRTVAVHRLVARAFLGQPPDGQEVLHGPRRNSDGSLCDWLGNLSYGTKPENMADKLRDGTDNRGASHPLAKLTEDDVREIRALYASTQLLGRFHPDRWTQAKLAEKFGVNTMQINRILRGHRWGHLRPTAK